MEKTLEIIIQISIIINLTLSIVLIVSTYNNKKTDPTSRFAYMLSIASVISIIISYIILPGEKDFTDSTKSILTFRTLDFKETSRLYIKVFVAIEYYITIQYLIKMCKSKTISSFLKRQLYVIMPLYTTSILLFDKPIPFRLIYLIFETPIILFCCTTKIIDIIHDINVKDISNNAEFLFHFGILFLFGSSFPLTYILYYRINENISTLFAFNILNSICYTIFYIFLIKSVKCTMKISK
jgi:hypothetical protein